MANNVMMALMKVSLSTSVILVFLLLLAPLLGKRYRAKWRYLAWLAVSIRLLIPMAFTFPEAPVQIGIPESVLADGYSRPATDYPESADPVDPPAMEAVSAGDRSQSRQTDAALPAGHSAETKIPSPARLAFWIWLAGMAVFFCIQAVVYIRFIRRVHYSPRGEVPAYIRDKWLEAGKELGLVRLPVIAVCQCVPSPILTGLLKPKLLLPHGQYSPQEISFILSHELVHFRRRDLW